MKSLFILLLISYILSACTSESSNSPVSSKTSDSTIVGEIELTPISCDGSPMKYLAEYINDFKGLKIFDIKGDKFKPTGKVIPYRKWHSRKPEYEEDLRVVTYSIDLDESESSQIGRLDYLLLEKDNCPLLLETFQYDTTLANRKMNRMIHLAIWQKSEDNWQKVSVNYFPLEALKDRVRFLTGEEWDVKEEDNTIIIHATSENSAVYSLGNSSDPIISFDIHSLTSLVWENGQFDFVLNNEELNRINAVASKCDTPTSTSYIGFMGSGNLVELSMNIEKTHKETTSFTGKLDIRGKENFRVEGQFISKRKEMRMILYKGDEKVISLKAKVGYSPFLRIDPIGFSSVTNDDVESQEFFLLVQKDLLKHSLKPQLASELCDYSNEIFMTISPILNNELLFDGIAVWNYTGYDYILKKDSSYENNFMNFSIKKITKINKNYFSYDIDFSDYIHNMKETETIDLSTKGTIHHILLAEEVPTVLELGLVKNIIHQEEFDFSTVEGEELVNNIIQSVVYLRVIQRSLEGLWVDVSKEILPSKDELMDALTIYYSELGEYNDPCYECYISHAGKEKWMNTFDPYMGHTSYRFAISKAYEKSDAAKKGKLVDYSIFWKNNALYLNENGRKLYWTGKTFELRSKDDPTSLDCVDAKLFEPGEERTIEYVGNIVAKDKIGMKLTFKNADGEDYIEGTYWFTDNNNDKFELTGLYNQDTKEIYLNRLKGAVVQELFVGKIANDCSITGILKKGTKELAFSIEQAK